jgi:hypothetical protein
MDTIHEEEREMCQKLLNRECDNLLNDIKRLQAELNMQKQRLKNVMDLVSKLYQSQCQIIPIPVIGIQ